MQGQFEFFLRTGEKCQSHVSVLWEAVAFALILFGRRPTITVAWGNAPGLAPRMDLLAEGHIHPGECDTLNMAFGQNVSCRLCFLGLCPRLR